MRLGAPTVLWLLALAAAIALPGGAAAEQSSQPSSPAAGHLSAGTAHSCVVLSAAVRCWGFGGNGRLGAAAVAIGDDETPASFPPVDVGAVDAVSAGDGHTCALRTDRTVRCWGFGGNGRLGYGNINDIGDDETAGTAGAVPIGGNGTAKAITAGDSHSCAILDDDSVRCWGYGAVGQLGYANATLVGGVLIGQDVGDDETPASVAPVSLGTDRTAKAISAGESHTCAILDDDSVRCWGYGANGQLGTASNANVGDDETPASVPPVDLGATHKAKAISAGSQHTCAILDDDTVRCWGFGANGQLGYGNTNTIGDNETPATTGPVDLGGHTAKAIAAGRQHTCALLDDGSVRCWGSDGFGQLGYGNGATIGDDETPAAAGPVDLGPGAHAIAISAGRLHTCAQLDDLSVRCWGYGANGRLGLCNEISIGDDEPPSSVGPIDLGAGTGCAPPPVAGGGGGTSTPPAPPPPPPAPAAAAPATAPAADPLVEEAARARALRTCLRAAARGRKAARSRARRACVKRYGRVPGRISRLRARAISSTEVELTFIAAGSNGRHAPAARAYLVRQSLRPIRRPRDFRRAPSLCHGSCSFASIGMGTRITLTITGLRPRTIYYYSVAARDNVSHRAGPRSPAVRVRTR